MHWLFYNNPSKYPIERKIWVKIRILYETDKVVRWAHHPSSHPEQSQRTILVYCNGKKIWIPKARIYKIRLRKGVFEVYVRESMLE